MTSKPDQNTPSTPNYPVLAAIQVNSGEDIDANLTRCASLIRAAARDGANLVGLPENFAYLGSNRDHKLTIAEVLPDPRLASTVDSTGTTLASTRGPIFGLMSDLAKELNIWLLLGGFPEKIANSQDRIHNTSVLLSPSGNIVARYRKMHLFHVDLPGGDTFREQDDVVAGDELVVAATPWGGLGLSICYDLRFPELYRALSRSGARFLSVPSAFTRHTGKDHWHPLLRARAIENQAFVLAPAQWGQHGPRRQTYGHALIVDPWGTVISECGDYDGYALARADLSYQDEIRNKLPVLQHRRL